MELKPFVSMGQHNIITPSSHRESLRAVDCGSFIALSKTQSVFRRNSNIVLPYYSFCATRSLTAHRFVRRFQLYHSNHADRLGHIFDCLYNSICFYFLFNQQIFQNTISDNFSFITKEILINESK